MEMHYEVRKDKLKSAGFQSLVSTVLLVIQDSSVGCHARTFRKLWGGRSCFT